MTSSASWGFVEGDPITAELTVVRRLGGGSAYEAYLAFDEHTYGPVVVKVVRPDRVDDEHSLRGLAREVEALATVNHPVVVRGLRHELDGDRPHVVLEHVEISPETEEAAAPGLFASLTVKPTPFGSTHPVTQFGANPEESAARFSTLPPLSTLNTVSSVKPGATTLLEGSGDGVSDQPVLSFQRYGRGKAIALSSGRGAAFKGASANGGGSYGSGGSKGSGSSGASRAPASVASNPAAVRAEALNTFNTPQFRSPNLAFGVSNSNFGKITEQANFSRMIQLGVRFFF